MENLNSIVNYIEFLKKEKNYSVTIHMYDLSVPFVLHGLRKYDFHDNPYCACMKQTEAVHWACLKCKRKAIEKCHNEGAFSGMCHAGVFEYNYPIIINERKVGMLSVGSYRTEESEEYITRISDKYNLDKNMLLMAHRALNENIPPKEEVDTLIVPLLSMLELFAYKRGADMTVKKTLFDEILEHIKYNYTQKITTERICNRFYCSRSYIAHSFKNHTGKSFPEYVNSLRIESAKEMLENSSLSVAEIAAIVGFEERSYFAKCFARETGISPREWRQKYGKQPNKKGEKL